MTMRWLRGGQGAPLNGNSGCAPAVHLNWRGIGRTNTRIYQDPSSWWKEDKWSIRQASRSFLVITKCISHSVTFTKTRLCQIVLQCYMFQHFLWFWKPRRYHLNDANHVPAITTSVDPLSPINKKTQNVPPDLVWHQIQCIRKFWLLKLLVSYA